MVADVKHVAAEEFRKANAENLGSKLGVKLNGVDSNVETDTRGPDGARPELTVIKDVDYQLLGH